MTLWDLYKIHRLVGAQSIALRESLMFLAEQCSSLRLPISFEMNLGNAGSISASICNLQSRLFILQY
jgi:hypothetical protein